jgi:hypothetical protein
MTAGIVTLREGSQESGGRALVSKAESADAWSQRVVPRSTLADHAKRDLLGNVVQPRETTSPEVIDITSGLLPNDIPGAGQRPRLTSVAREIARRIAADRAAVAHHQR